MKERHMLFKISKCLKQIWKIDNNVVALGGIFHQYTLRISHKSKKNIKTKNIAVSVTTVITF